VKLCYETLGFAGPLANKAEIEEKFKTALDVFVNSGHMLKGNSFAAGGDKLTIADFAIWSNLVVPQTLGELIWKLPAEVVAYIERCEAACPAMKETRKPYDGYASQKLL